MPSDVAAHFIIIISPAAAVAGQESWESLVPLSAAFAACQELWAPWARASVVAAIVWRHPMATARRRLPLLLPLAKERRTRRHLLAVVEVEEQHQLLLLLLLPLLPELEELLPKLQMYRRIVTALLLSASSGAMRPEAEAQFPVMRHPQRLRSLAVAAPRQQVQLSAAAVVASLLLESPRPPRAKCRASHRRRTCFPRRALPRRTCV